MDPWESDQAMCIVWRIAQTNWLDDELKYSPGFWDICAKESCEKIKNATPRSGVQVREMFFRWLNSDSFSRRSQVDIDYAGFEIWTGEEIDALLQQLESSPNVFERVKMVWKGLDCLLVRLKKFDEISKDFNRQRRMKVLCGANSYHEQQEALKAREYNYDGNAFETLCQIKRFTLDLGGPEWSKCIDNVDVEGPFLYDENRPEDPILGLPKKQIFSGYSFLLGYSNEKMRFVAAREELKNLIVRNGGTVKYGPPAEGLNVSVTVWPTSSSSSSASSSTTTLSHLCHHSSIYDAVKKQEFNFSKHLKHSSQDDCVTEYIGFPIKAADSVKSRETVGKASRSSSLQTGTTATNALEPPGNAKRAEEDHQRNQVLETDNLQLRDAALKRGMSPKGTGQGQSPQNEDNAERDKVAPALLTETETQHDTLDLEQAAVEKKDNGENLNPTDLHESMLELNDQERAPSGPSRGSQLDTLKKSDVEKTVQHHTVSNESALKNDELELDNGNVTVGGTVSLQEKGPSPCSAGSLPTPQQELSAIEKLELLSQSKTSSKAAVSPNNDTDFLYNFEEFQKDLEDESCKEPNALQVQDRSSQSSDEDWCEPPRKVTKSEPNHAAVDFETFRKSFTNPNDDLIYMCLKWTVPVIRNRSYQIKFLLANERGEFISSKFDNVRMRVSRAAKKTDRVKLIGTTCGFSQVVVDAFLNLWSVSNSDSSQN